MITLQLGIKKREREREREREKNEERRRKNRDREWSVALCALLHTYVRGIVPCKMLDDPRFILACGRINFLSKLVSFFITQTRSWTFCEF
jgi:hypothetical protein